MEKQAQELTKITAAFADQVQHLRTLAEQVSQLGDQISKMSGEFNNADRDHGLRVVEKGAPNQKINTAGAPRIIPFPKAGLFINRSSDPSRLKTERVDCPAPVQAAPGKQLPPDIPDFRPLLQRDGLILLAWDKRSTESGCRFTAYWVTSTGTPRFYASKLYSSDDFSSARPDHKSYAAEDGIEFYGQKAPLYIVHVAPELMMSNPHHGELRKTHITVLQQQGVKADFNYRYLLKNEKKRDLPHGRLKNRSCSKTGA